MRREGAEAETAPPLFAPLFKSTADTYARVKYKIFLSFASQVRQENFGQQHECVVIQWQCQVVDFTGFRFNERDDHRDECDGSQFGKRHVNSGT